MSVTERVNVAVRLTGVSAYGIRFADLVVRYGEVVVLTGPNGAGKSTLSRVVVGELTASGSVQVLGTDPLAADLKGRLGYLVQDLATMGSLTSRDVLDICAAVRGCGTAYAHQLADRLHLDLDREMAKLSRGELRRLGIVQALMHEPELVVLDDPLTELDDEAGRVVPDLLRAAAARGAAVVVTLQSPADAVRYAGRVVPLTSGDAAEDRRTEQPVEPESLRTPVAARGASRRGDGGGAGAVRGGGDPPLRARVAPLAYVQSSADRSGVPEAKVTFRLEPQSSHPPPGPVPAGSGGGRGRARRRGS